MDLAMFEDEHLTLGAFIYFLAQVTSEIQHK